LEGSILFSMGQEGDIAKMNADGGDRVLLLDRAIEGDVYSDRLAAWRPDGKGISYVVDDFEKVEIWVMDGDGSNPRLLVADVAPVTSHSWSPDGTRIAFVDSGHNICILDLASQTVTNLTGEYQSDGHVSDTHLSDARDPDWSPDGSRIAFSASAGQNQDIYVINVDGTGLTGLTNHEARDGHPDWSPDGTALVFSSTRRSQRYLDLYSLDLALGTEEEGNMPLQLTYADKLETRPDWSPDRAWIVFLSHELGAGHGTLYAVSGDGRYLVRLTADNVFHSPRWQP
jgi:TolB protein